MSIVVVIILHQLFILDVSVLLLNSVELISQGEVVFVSLLDLEDFGLQLGNQKVFLVTSEMDGIVILYKKKVSKII